MAQSTTFDSQYARAPCETRNKTCSGKLLRDDTLELKWHFDDVLGVEGIVSMCVCVLDIY